MGCSARAGVVSVFSSVHGRGNAVLLTMAVSGDLTSAVFYLGVLACWAAIGARVPWAWVATGVTLDITFLGHTAPAMILGLCVLTAAYMSADRWGARTRHAMTALAIAVLVSLPLLASIVGHY